MNSFDDDDDDDDKGDKKSYQKTWLCTKKPEI